MRKTSFIAMLFMPTFAFASVNISNCEVIGYRNTNVTEKFCNTMEKCQQNFEKKKEVDSADKAKEDFDRCVKSIKSSEECEQYIAEQQEMAHKEYLIYKCPMNDWFSLIKKKEDFRDNGEFQKYAYYNDGTPIDTDAMITDDEYAYLFRIQVPFDISPLNENTKYGYDMIVPADKDGLMFYFLDRE